LIEINNKNSLENILLKIEAALDSVRPYLNEDGGNVRIVELTNEMTVKIELMGACGTCPMSKMTFKAGLEEAILRMVPEVLKVEAINLAI
jgi:Fe-S cluster biogenesis protein NfuA